MAGLIQGGQGALPSRFRRQRILIVGCGDVGMRLAKLMHPRVNLLALTHSGERVAALRAAGLRPLRGNLDDAQTLARLGGVATHVVYLAPPRSDDQSNAQDCEYGLDLRSLHAARALQRRTAPRRVVYASTSGLYGDRLSAWVRESDAPKPLSPRAQRRLHAERIWRSPAGPRAAVLRLPGIYADDRGGGVLARLRAGLPIPNAEDDVYTNRIHADDSARAAMLALYRAGPRRVYNINEDSKRKMGELQLHLAEQHGLPAPARLSRAQLASQLSPMQMSFLRESRRMDNTRMRVELRMRTIAP